MLKLTTEDKLILTASRLRPAEKDLHLISELIPVISHWKNFTDIAIQNGVGPMIFRNISSVSNTKMIPQEILNRFKQTYFRSLSRNMLLYEYFKNAAELFAKEGIQVIALKGILLAETIYQDIGLRQMSDIDLLIKKEDASKCRDLLIGMGYSYQENIKADSIKDLQYAKHLPPFIMNGVSIELHTSIHLDNAGISVHMEDLWSRSYPVVLNTAPAFAFELNDLVLHLILHIDEHFNDGKPQLYSLCDIAHVIEKNKNEIDWNALEESGKNYNCRNIVFNQFYILNKYFAVEIPEIFLQKIQEHIDPRVEKLFIHYLRHFRSDMPLGTTNRNLEILSHIGSFKNKINYIIHDIFPSRDYMCLRYHLNHRYLVYWYYLVRMETGLRKLFLYFIKKIIPSAKPKKQKGN